MRFALSACGLIPASPNAAVGAVVEGVAAVSELEVAEEGLESVEAEVVVEVEVLALVAVEEAWESAEAVAEMSKVASVARALELGSAGEPESADSSAAVSVVLESTSPVQESMCPAPA